MSYPRFFFPKLSNSFDQDIKAISPLQMGGSLWEDCDLNEEKIDLYKEGYDACRKEFEDKLNDERCKNAFTEILQRIFDASTISNDLLEEVFKSNVQILEHTIDNLCLENSANFSLVFQSLFKLLKQHYKEGGIRIEVGSYYYKTCLDMVKDLPDLLFKKDLIEVVELPELDKEVCRICYNSTIFEYDKNQIVTEIKDRLKSFY
jgi:hypothetical protein